MSMCIESDWPHTHRRTHPMLSPSLPVGKSLNLAGLQLCTGPTHCGWREISLWSDVLSQQKIVDPCCLHMCLSCCTELKNRDIALASLVCGVGRLTKTLIYKSSSRKILNIA